MKFRSWYIVLLGMILQISFGFLLVASGKDTDDWGGVVATTLGLIVILISIGLAIGLGVLPLLLLAFRKTRKAGAIVSILFGIIGISTQLGIIVGIPLLIAGVLSLWRKI